LLFRHPVVYLDLLLDNDRERESYFAMLTVIPLPHRG
jgi:hypothetical protein